MNMVWGRFSYTDDSALAGEENEYHDGGYKIVHPKEGADAIRKQVRDQTR